MDAAGEAIVLEFVHGALRAHNNTVGVLTNDPTWDWHVANLNNYASLQRGWYKTNTDGIEVRHRKDRSARRPWRRLRVAPSL